MKILLNMPFSLSDKERSTLLATWPDLEIVVVNEPDPAKLDGTDVVVLIAEMVPKQLESWTQLRWVQLLSAGSNQLNGHPI